MTLLSTVVSSHDGSLCDFDRTTVMCGSLVAITSLIALFAFSVMETFRVPFVAPSEFFISGNSSRFLRHLSLEELL